MESVFVPFAGDGPKSVEVNGHTLLIVGAAAEDLLADLHSIGADEIREFPVLDDGEDSTEMDVFDSLAERIGGGIVVSPKGVSLSTMIRSLEAELPWIQ